MIPTNRLKKVKGEIRKILTPYRSQWCGCIEGDLSEVYEQTEIKVIEDLFEYIVRLDEEYV